VRENIPLIHRFKSTPSSDVFKNPHRDGTTKRPWPWDYQVRPTQGTQWTRRFAAVLVLGVRRLGGSLISSIEDKAGPPCTTGRSRYPTTAHKSMVRRAGARGTTCSGCIARVGCCPVHSRTIGLVEDAWNMKYTARWKDRQGWFAAVPRARHGPATPATGLRGASPCWAVAACWSGLRRRSRRRGCEEV
jgi:hypothetical protein